MNKITNSLQGRSIFLVGMMACGKSKTGPKLAQMLNYKFLDLDFAIEKVANKSISNIFAQDGEEIFRKYETQCLKEIIKFPSLVISTGGGVVTRAENWGILRQGIVVWIDLDETYAIERIKKDSNKRPLLKEKDIKSNYINLFKSRKRLYAQADIRIKVQDENIDQVVQKIIFNVKDKITN